MRVFEMKFFFYRVNYTKNSKSGDFRDEDEISANLISIKNFDVKLVQVDAKEKELQYLIVIDNV